METQTEGDEQMSRNEKERAASYLVVVVELNSVPLAIANTTWYKRCYSSFRLS